MPESKTESTPAPKRQSFGEQIMQRAQESIAPPAPEPTPTPAPPKTESVPATKTTPHIATSDLPDFPGQVAPAPAAVPEITDEPETSPRAKDWKALKSRLSEKDKRIAELEAKQSSAPSVEVNERLQKLEAERDELSGRLKQFAIEKHPQFVSHFDGRVKQTTEYVAKMVPEGQKFADILTMPASVHRNAMLDELLPSLSPTQQVIVGAAVVEIDRIQSERASELARSGENYKLIERNQQLEVERLNQTRNTEIERQLKLMQANPLFQKRDGDESWNQQVETRINAFKRHASGQTDVASQARLAAWGVAAPALLSELNTITERHNAEKSALEARIKALESSTPNPANGESKPAGLTSPKDRQPGETFGQWQIRVAKENAATI